MISWGLWPPRRSRTWCEHGFFRKVALEELDVLHRVHGQDAVAHPALPPTRRRPPATSRRGRARSTPACPAGSAGPFHSAGQFVSWSANDNRPLRLFDVRIVNVSCSQLWLLLDRAIGKVFSHVFPPLPALTGRLWP